MKIKESIPSRLFDIFNVVLMVVLALIMIFPYLNVLAKSFNDAADSARGGITFFPRVFTVENFKTIFADSTTISALFVSVARVLIAVVLSLLVQFSAAYALSKQNFPGKKFFVTLYMIPMFIAAGQVPLYVIITRLNLLNTFWKEYYVSVNGSDSSPGTKEAPFKTVQKAKDAVRAVNQNMQGGAEYKIASVAAASTGTPWHADDLQIFFATEETINDVTYSVAQMREQQFKTIKAEAIIIIYRQLLKR